MKPYKSIYTALLLVLVLGACKVSKDIPLPVNAAPEKFRGSVSTDTASIAALPYKDFFKEQTIRNLIDTAIINNYDMQIALKNMEAAALLFSQSKLGNIPELNLKVGANSSRPSDNSLNGLQIGQFSQSKHIEDYSVTGGLSWEADIWRKIANQRNAAGAVFMQSAEVKKADRKSVV